MDADGGEEVEIRKSHLDGLWSRLTAPFDYNHDLIPKVHRQFSAENIGYDATALSLKATSRVIIDMVCMTYGLFS